MNDFSMCKECCKRGLISISDTEKVCFGCMTYNAGYRRYPLKRWHDGSRWELLTLGDENAVINWPEVKLLNRMYDSYIANIIVN